jgi:hypothetical protein
MPNLGKWVALICFLFAMVFIAPTLIELHDPSTAQENITFAARGSFILATVCTIALGAKLFFFRKR